MDPYEHGEVFVTEDGAECDLDIGYYERFTGQRANCFDATTTGQIYLNVLERERRGEFAGKTVQIIPHITDAIKAFIQNETEKDDFVICEVGGTVGDIEGLPFLEAIRQLRQERGRKNVCFIHVAPTPFLKSADELKTKPLQHSVRELQHSGIQADILMVRTERPLTDEKRAKIALFSNVPQEDVVEAADVSNIYLLPLTYHQAGLDSSVCRYFDLPGEKPNLQVWTKIARTITQEKDQITIGIVGKYAHFQDAYKSLGEALSHASMELHVDLKIIWLSAQDYEGPDATQKIKKLKLDALIAPGGFGKRGTDGTINCIQYVREHNIPFLGICLGMQLTAIETARNQCDLTQASSTEFDPDALPLVKPLNLPSSNVQKKNPKGFGGKTRLGAHKCCLVEGSLAAHLYKKTDIMERQRNGYQVNAEYEAALQEGSLSITGWSEDRAVPEILENRDCDFFMAVQFHPEFQSWPDKPHPLFYGLLKTAIKRMREMLAA
jgi:CTP synthase